MAASPVDRFTSEHPSLDSFWRAVVLFGRNVASYKLALAHALLEVGAEGKDLVSLDELAMPYARRLCEHLTDHDKQGVRKPTSSSPPQPRTPARRKPPTSSRCLKRSLRSTASPGSESNYSPTRSGPNGEHSTPGCG